MQQDKTAIFRDRIAEPFFTVLGLQIEEVRLDFCRMRMPFHLGLRTEGQVVHGGAIASLVDSAGVVAVWSNVPPEITRGATATMTVNYLAAAEAVDLTAEAQVVRRGRSVVFVDIDVTSPAGDRIAKGSLVYKLSKGR
ncbi:MAG: PaaI family thioesterase [Deltaproteobacteria bacterium]|nr:PaaI family thioesterase [Deltaproteobacteria bacterium]